MADAAGKKLYDVELLWRPTLELGDTVTLANGATEKLRATDAPPGDVEVVGESDREGDGVMDRPCVGDGDGDDEMLPVECTGCNVCARRTRP